jgi:hypothetical protein
MFFPFVISLCLVIPAWPLKLDFWRFQLITGFPAAEAMQSADDCPAGHWQIAQSVFME